MAVLVEAISVIVRRDAIDAKYPGGWKAYVDAAPSETLCYDGKLARVGFMAPHAVEAFITRLTANGLTYLVGDEAQDIAVVDQQRGPMTKCEWLEFAKLPFGEAGGKVSACWFFDSPKVAAGVHLPGKSLDLSTPSGWKFEGSLSHRCTFVPMGGAEGRPEHLHNKKEEQITSMTQCGPGGSEKYALVWLPRPSEHEFVNAAFGAVESTGPIFLPIFLSGDDLTDFRRTTEVNFNAVTLLYGILYAIGDRNAPFEHSTSSCYFCQALDKLTAALKMPDVETLVLTAGANVRQGFGSALSATMLRNALQILPDSNKIRCDCITDIWVAAEERDEPNHIEVLTAVTAILKEIDCASLAQPFRKCLSYIATVAFAEVDPQAEDTFIRQHFSDNDLDWIPKEKEQIAEYRRTKQFSWKALSIR
ncbi:MAG: hypothetical protein AB1724_06440 [Thermodesulfobacteriota bacterium]